MQHVLPVGWLHQPWKFGWGWVLSAPQVVEMPPNSKKDGLVFTEHPEYLKWLV